MEDFVNYNPFISYEYQTDVQSGAINSFKVPKKGDWVVVFCIEDQDDTISFSYSIDLVEPTFFAQFWYIFVILGVVAIGGVIAIVIISSSKKKIDENINTFGTHNARPMNSQPTQQFQEVNKNIIRPQISLFCKSCGEKNPSLDRFCKNCGTDLTESPDKLNM